MFYYRQIQESIWTRILLLLLIFLASILWLMFLVRVARPDINTSKISSQQQSNDQQQKRIDISRANKNNNNNSHHTANNGSFTGDNHNISNNKLDDKKDQEQEKLQSQEENNISFPSNLDQLKHLVRILFVLSHTHPRYVFLLFSSAYLFKQTFAIPGSIFMNILGGAIYGTWVAFPLCSLLTAIGATFCFLLSRMVGHSVLERYFPEKLEYFRRRIYQHREQNNSSTFLVLISLRLFPMTPNWFLNIASPMVNIPIRLFFPSILFGLMPYNFICVQTGSILSQINSMDDVFTIKTFLGSLLVAIVFASPTLLAKRFRGPIKPKLSRPIKIRWRLT